MKVRNVLDLVTLKLTAPEVAIETPTPDRATLQMFLTHTIYSVLEMEEWSWAIVYLRPALQLESNKESYALPRDFGTNFLRGGQDGTNYTAKISDGSTDSILTYERPETLFSRDRETLSNAKPTYYTIVNSGGRRFIYVYPTPDDSATYTIWGAYRPVWDQQLLNEDDEIFIPNHSVVVNGTLLHVQERPEWRQAYTQALNSLYQAEAKTSRAKMFPRQGRMWGYTNEYDPMR